MVNCCCVCGVERSVLTQDLTFHNLPKDPDIQRKWIEILKKANVKIVKRLLVCSNHFKPEDYRESSLKPLLKRDAVPRLDFMKKIINDRDRLATDIHGDHHYLEVSNAEASVSPDFPDESQILTRKNCLRSFNAETLVDSGVSTDLAHNPKRTRAEQSDAFFEDEMTIEIEDRRDHNYSLSMTLSQPEATKNRKRKTHDDGSDASTKKRCYDSDFGVFRQEDFKDKEIWNRFLGLYQGMKRENLLLKLQKGRLREKVIMYKHMMRNSDVKLLDVS